MTFFKSSTTNFEFPPLFPVSVHCSLPFPLCFAKIIIPPYFSKFSLCFRNCLLLFTYFLCISFPPPLTMMHLCITQCTYSLLPSQLWNFAPFIARRGV